MADEKKPIYRNKPDISYAACWMCNINFYSWEHLEKHNHDAHDGRFTALWPAMANEEFRN